MMRIAEALEAFRPHRGDAIVVPGRGGRYWIERTTRPELDVPLGDPAMGGHAGFALGLALARPEPKLALFDSEGDTLDAARGDAAYAQVLFLFLGGRVVHSRFGMLLQGTRSNERRMIALGFPTFRYKLAAFVMAGAVCGLAGALFANLTLFVSPSIMHWTRSGEILMMVILGGIGPLFGPVIGAAAYLLLESVLARWSEHWQTILGPLLILVVLFSKSGPARLVKSR